jgi:hypothetical protein
MIFQIGFNKCATTALFWLFVNSGHAALHSSGRRSRKAGHQVVSRQHPQIQIHHNICSGLPPVAGLEDFNAFFDMEYDRPQSEIKIENFKFFDRFALAYPDAKFILNTRDKQSWLRSRSRHNDGLYLARSMKRWGLSKEATLERWAGEFERHNDSVRNFFQKEHDRLIIFDIDESSIESVVDFAAPHFKLLPQHWGMSRKTDMVIAKKRAR